MEVIREDGYVCLKIERKNRRDHQHKLAHVTEGPSKVMNADTHAVAIEKANRFVERVSRLRAILAPSRCL